MRFLLLLRPSIFENNADGSESGSAAATRRICSTRRRNSGKVSGHPTVGEPREQLTAPGEEGKEKCGFPLVAAHQMYAAVPGGIL